VSTQAAIDARLVGVAIPLTRRAVGLVVARFWGARIRMLAVLRWPASKAVARVQVVSFADGLTAIAEGGHIARVAEARIAAGLGHIAIPLAREAVSIGRAICGPSWAAGMHPIDSRPAAKAFATATAISDAEASDRIAVRVVHGHGRECRERNKG